MGQPSLKRSYGVRGSSILGAALRSGRLAADSASLSIPRRKFIAVAVPYFEYVRGMARTLATIIVAIGVPLLLTVKFAAPHYETLAAVALLSAISYVLVLWFLECTPAEAKMLEH